LKCPSSKALIDKLQKPPTPNPKRFKEAKNKKAYRIKQLPMSWRNSITNQKECSDI
jgi:hypothetical protein